MTIDDLKNVRRQKLRVEDLQERIERLRSRAEYNQRQLGECGRSDPTRDRLAEYAAELDELERELTGEMIALEKQLAYVDTELAKLPENQEKVLRLRYVDGMSWRKVARLLNYCEQYCKSINVKAKGNIMFDNITYK
ncbi:MAG: sigma factor-like helix-turn-helix DNA-binding protein [Eubacteriales bacterium]|nr:sigma factor-like helix-turn-helix DNA-binding protein [Eubacteriales bacterium]